MDHLGKQALVLTWHHFVNLARQVFPDVSARREAFSPAADQQGFSGHFPKFSAQFFENRHGKNVDGRVFDFENRQSVAGRVVDHWI